MRSGSVATRIPRTIASVSDAIAAAKAGVGKDGPLVVADGTDNPGGGGYNDTTPVLQALIDADVQNVAFGTIFDPGTVQQAIKAGVGAEIDVVLGGHTDPSMGGPVKAKAIVKMLSDGSFKNDGPMNAGVETSMGPTAVLRIGGIDVVTISNRIQTIDLQVFLSQGIDPKTKSVVVVKSVQHFRAAYGPIAREVVLVDSGGICSPDINRLKFTKLRRPIWPLDGVNDPAAGATAMNITRAGTFPGASFGATLRLDGDAAKIVAAAEAEPEALPAALADAKGLLLIQGMNGISDDPDLLIRLSRVFGPEVEDYRSNLTDLKAVHVSVPEILLVSNMAPVSKAPPKRPDPPLAADGLIPTQYPHRKGWHTDQSYRRPPPDISLFYAVTPAEKETGQTLFANGILAYAALPPGLKAKVDTLVGLHAQPGSGRSRDAALAGRTPRTFAVHERSQPQPVVRTHPVTGEKSSLSLRMGSDGLVRGPVRRHGARSARGRGQAARRDHGALHGASLLLRPRMDRGRSPDLGQSLPRPRRHLVRRRPRRPPDGARRCTAIPAPTTPAKRRAGFRRLLPDVSASAGRTSSARSGGPGSRGRPGAAGRRRRPAARCRRADLCAGIFREYLLAALEVVVEVQRHGEARSAVVGAPLSRCAAKKCWPSAL